MKTPERSKLSHALVITEIRIYGFVNVIVL